jgi:DNA-binding PadR family transcriptional regulator
MTVPSHRTKLESAGLVTIDKRFVGKRPDTNIRITPDGKQRITTHWRELEQLRSIANVDNTAAHA